MQEWDPEIKYVRRKVVNHRSLLAYVVCPHAEPSPEEKLQKLHTDIKFALKVDNPVSDIIVPVQDRLISSCSVGSAIHRVSVCTILGHRAVSTSPGRSRGCTGHQPDPP